MNYFLDTYKDSEACENLIKTDIMACTYPAYYRYWVNSLFERMMRLFVWENTYEEKDNKIFGILPKHIEAPLILDGKCFISKLPTEDDLTSFFGSLFSPTKYYDEFKKTTIRCPIYSGTRTLNKDAVMIENTAIRSASFAHVHHYATLLAHTEVTLVDVLIDARDAGGVPVAKNQIQLESIRAYQNKRFIGKYGVVTDLAGLGVGYAGSDRKTSQRMSEIMETRNKLLRAFYCDIGVRSTFEKRSNVNSLEIDGDTSMLLLNVSDMLKRREIGCELVNSLYGTNWTVHIAEEIDYNDENADIITEAVEQEEKGDAEDERKVI